MKRVLLPLPHLPEEIIANILSRLPVKHLTQLKCVCKPWLSLISDPNFAKLQLAHSKNNNSFACYRVLLVTEPLESVACEASADDLEDIESKLSTKLEFPIEMKEAPDSDELVDGWLDLGGSCDGLICAVFDHQRIFVWNPTTREAKELTKLPAFDPKGTLSYGLGYDFSTDDYKVVRVARASASNASPNATQFQVLSLKTNIWRSVEGQGLQSGTEIDGQGIFLNGVLHWLASTQIGPKKVYSIIAFNMVQEKFYELVRIPDKHREDTEFCSLGIHGDCLCLFIGCGYVIDFEAFLLKEYGVESSWTRLFRVQRDNLHGHKYWEVPLCYTSTGKVVINYDGRDLVWYDPKDQTEKSFTPSNEWDWFHPAVYIQSLVSPHSYGNASSTNS